MERPGGRAWTARQAGCLEKTSLSAGSSQKIQARRWPGEMYRQPGRRGLQPSERKVSEAPQNLGRARQELKIQPGKNGCMKKEQAGGGY